MSSKETPNGAFPIVCERCGEQAARPTTEHTHGDDQFTLRAMRCAACNHGWFVPAPNKPVTLRRKSDRRANPREE